MADEILIVDDSPVSLVMTSILLKQLGYATLSVKSASDALKAIEKKRFLAIIMDYHMPGTTGDIATQEIHKMPNGQGAPVICFTSESDSNDIQKIYHSGVARVVMKPAGIDILSDALKDAFAYTIVKPSQLLGN